MALGARAGEAGARPLRLDRSAGATRLRAWRSATWTCAPRHRRDPGADAGRRRRGRSGDAGRDGGGDRARIPGAELTVVPEAAHCSRSSSRTPSTRSWSRFWTRVAGGCPAAPEARPSTRGSPTARACSASSTCSARSKRPAPSPAVAGLHHPHRLGRNLGRSDAAVEDALDGDARP